MGALRWQAPQPVQPSPEDGGQVIPAVERPPRCPQSGAFGTPAKYGFNSGLGDEDCLFLNVYAAPNATDLPVLVWIHGGGWNVFGASYDPSVWLNTNDNGFIVVVIQYRLGAFGFLSSPEVKEHGELNAGLLDQRFALEWVQEHIVAFGGDPTRVTLAGESAGAGSVMYLAMAYGGEESHLFTNVSSAIPLLSETLVLHDELNHFPGHQLIAASPYTPPVYGYDEEVPVGNWHSFAQLAGCSSNSSALAEHANTFSCLVAADTEVLQNASGTVSTTRGYYGSFAWLPVVDGDFVRQRPSEQLLDGAVSGQRLLVGNNANEGVPLIDPVVETHDKYDDFISTTFPLFTEADKEQLGALYRVDEAEEGDNGVRFDTLGDSGLDANTQSSYATGIQQTVFNLAGETNFDCPAQWLAEAYSVEGRTAWKYQFSPAPSHHGADLSAYFAINATTPSADFRNAFQKMWGNFIMHNSPVISFQEATAGYDNATAPQDGDKLAWPEYKLSQPRMLDLNTTGGRFELVPVTEELSYYIQIGDGIVNTFRLVDSWTWEGGRGERCGFWRDVAERVPQ